MTKIDRTTKYDFKKPDKSIFKVKKGLSSDIVREISKERAEPKWMLDMRLKAFDLFKKMSMPSFGPDLSGLDLEDLHYYAKSTNEKKKTWQDVPDEIKQSFEKLGIPEQEREFLAGVGAMYDSEVVYRSLQESLEKQGIIFCDLSTAIKKHEKLFKKYFGSVVPMDDNKFTALNFAFCSGGGFIYIPKNIKVEMPIQACFRMNVESLGHFAHSLIIADEGSEVQIIEGCTSPAYLKNSLHAGIAEVVVRPGAHVRITAVQNWSKNVYTLVTKRANVHKNGTMEWIEANIGSKKTMMYPCSVLMEDDAKTEITTLSLASQGQDQDTGAKVIHLGNNTSSKILSKSISKKGGISSFRGLVRVAKDAKNTKSKVQCDSLILDEKSKVYSYPILDVQNNESQVEHEAFVSKISEEQLFYLKQRGLSKSQAESLIVNGFIEPFSKHLPQEFENHLGILIDFDIL